MAKAIVYVNRYIQYDAIIPKRPQRLSTASHHLHLYQSLVGIATQSQSCASQQRRHEDNQYQSLLRTLAGEELVQSIYPQFSRLLHTATTGCVTTEEPHATCNQSSHQGAKSYTSGAGPGPFDPLE